MSTALQKRPSLLFQNLNNPVIIFRPVGKSTVHAVLDPLSILLNVFRFSRTMLPEIHRTITEQTVEILQPLMTGKILTSPVLKKTIRILHII